MFRGNVAISIQPLVISMINCERCGYPLPDGAEYCPNCGAPVRRKPEAAVPPVAPIGKLLQAGVLGAFLSVMITSIAPPSIQLYFIPSFVSSLVSVYLFRARRLDEAVTISLAVYLFADAILGGLIFGSIYVENIPLSQAYGDYMLTFVDVAMYVADPVTAVIAGYVGNRLIAKPPARKRVSYRYEKRREPGGIIYSLEVPQEKASVGLSHNV